MSSDLGTPIVFVYRLPWTIARQTAGNSRRRLWGGGAASGTDRYECQRGSPRRMSTPDSGAAGMSRPTDEYPRTWVVDGANVIGSRPDGWWRDRPGAAGRLVDAISARITRPGTHPRPSSRPEWPERIVVVLEGAARAGVPEGTVRPGKITPEKVRPADVAPEKGRHVPARADRAAPTIVVVHAPGHGDDAIVAAARDAVAPVVVITSDRQLAGRLRSLGAGVRRSGWLWELLDER
ncbi:hypothetical protein ThrDRAFT_01656 [Frankia casuarinae]|nr:hypothetical protein CcI6DRAFT_01273 [Frankia sp. CcI6]EYT92701.1 hypothetical protein ThrDRAFT_01656 [Frankia casuarinae]KDA43636.1 hypothetical protein BMG523Draft_01541 [Frankia sp. BMG5.23]KEZ36944.1 hypothetical protein CEDDRAFT_01712 [Frankia sp. CeD]KFB05101.1 hypothetical protein ALLO2DRAFT_02160 [Frankia sp. Allo2]